MKIRNGFVSNSSSSSFVIFGKIFTRGAFAKRCNFTKEEMKDIMENGIEDYEDRFGGLECIQLDDDGREWLFGESLRGDEKEISVITAYMNKLFDGGCKLYKGVDNCGIISLDEED
jgi:hypothetical protein